MRTGFQLVIFDNDGVLVDSEPIAARVLAGLLTRHGLPTEPRDAMREFIGSPMDRVRRISEERLGHPLPEDFERDYHEPLFERFRKELEPVEGVKEALGQIDLPRCVASSGSPERIRLSLQLVGLWEQFTGRAFSTEEVERGKPAPDLFLHAAAVLGAEPGRCAVIEDSPLGIEAANAAGMISFGFAGQTPAERLADARGGVFSRMSELPDLLHRIEPGVAGGGAPDA